MALAAVLSLVALWRLKSREPRTAAGGPAARGDLDALAVVAGGRGEAGGLPPAAGDGARSAPEGASRGRAAAEPRPSASRWDPEARAWKGAPPTPEMVREAYGPVGGGSSAGFDGRTGRPAGDESGSYFRLRAMAGGTGAGESSGKLPELRGLSAAASSPGRGSRGGGRTQENLPPDLVRQEERKIQGVWLDYWQRSETVRQYEKDWFSHPDLARLTLEYKTNHNPVAFMYGLVSSPSFPKLAWRYVRSPVMLYLLKDSIGVSSREAIDRSAGILAKDDRLGGFVDNLDRLVSAEGDPSGYSPVDQALPEAGQARVQGPRRSGPDEDGVRKAF